MHGTVSDIRHDVRVIVSEFERNVTSALHRTIVQGQEGNGGKHPLVSDTHSIHHRLNHSPRPRLKPGQ